MAKKPNPHGDEPIEQLLRVVDVIDCVPGNMPNRNGRPISIVTLAHLGELEQPLAISFADCKMLLRKLLISLSAHDDEVAERLLDAYEDDEE